MDTPHTARSSIPLRFRDEMEPVEIDIAAFCGNPRGATAIADEPIAFAAKPEIAAAHDHLRIFFQVAAFPIPAIVRLGSTEDLPDLGSWSLRPTAFGYIAEVPTGRSKTRNASWVFAACLPLAFAIPKLAAARDAAPEVQRPKSKSPPRLPDPEPPETPPPADGETPTGGETTTGSEATTDGETPTDGATDPSETSTADPFVGPETPPPPAVAEDAILDAAWEGVDGQDVDLRLKGGGKMRGHVGAVQRDTFTLIQEETGAVLVLPKSGVRSLRVRVAPPIPTKSGAGAIAGGVVLTTVGTPVFITGLVFVAVCPSCTYISLPMLFIGGGAIGGGIPLLVRGARRRDKWRAAVTARGVSAGIVPTRNGWTGGVRFRF